KERRYPRRASISSFGAGGANAHLIVEEYEPSFSASLVAREDSPQVIVLSAKNEERLQVYAEKLVKYLEITEASLADIAYTLQVGREALEERLALIVSTREELKQKLHQYCQGILDGQEFYQGNIKKDHSNYTLVQGEEGIAFIGQLISNRKMSKLAEFWVTGADVEWSLLSSESRPRRISLPTYPFARERYWVPECESSHNDLIYNRSIKEVLPVNVVYGQGYWKNTPLDTLAVNKEWKGSVLLFDRESYTQDQLRAQLPQGINVILVKAGEKFRSLGDYIYEVNPTREEDYMHLLESLRDQGLIPGYILHRWSRETVAVNDDSLSTRLERGIYSLLHLTKALMKLKLKNKVHLLYTYETDGNTQPSDAAIAGFAKTIRLEHPKLVYKTLEIQRTSRNTFSLSESISLMLKELMNQSEREYEVCYKDGNRFTKQLQEVIDGKRNNHMIPFRKKGVYLISGGAGGLGFIFAEFLAKQAQARLVLTGRSTLSPDKQRKLKELERLGAEVTYIQADISNQDAVGDLIRKIKSRFQEIHGVIHSAGVLRDGFIFNKTSQEMQEVLAPKVHGTFWLDEATKEEPLDFFVLFSSMAAISGNAGQCDYAYGNSFLDHYAVWRSEQDRPGKTLSINWPLWKEGSMTVGKEKEALLKTLGMEPMSTQAGIDAFVTGLNQPSPQIIVAQGDVKKIKEIWRINKQLVEEATIPVSKTVEMDDNEMIFQKIQEKVIQGVSLVLKIDKKDIDMNSELSEFGFDSVSLTEYSNILNQQYDLNIMPSIFFEHSTLHSFTEYLWEEHKQNLVDYYSDEIADSSRETIIQIKEVPMVREEATIPLELPTADNKRDFKEKNEQVSDSIAIVGISGVMPQSPDLNSFWKNLESGKDLITEIPDDRWDWKAYFGEPTKEFNKTPVKWGGFMPEVDKFDALFFGISPREAAMMDPQQRILMETVWKTIEDAGYKPSDFSGTKTGV
ncbi:hypothetical protein CN627_24585, partial [Bacillus wiedmannii]